MSGRRVLLTVGISLLATAVLPPVGAAAVHRARLRSAEEMTRQLASELRSQAGHLVEMARDVDVLCGMGRLPDVRATDAEGWVTASRSQWMSARRRPSPSDPWGNCYVVNLAALRTPGAIVWVLSAGPDGMIDTPFVSAAEAAGGDDVRFRVR